MHCLTLVFHAFLPTHHLSFTQWKSKKKVVRILSNKWCAFCLTMPKFCFRKFRSKHVRTCTDTVMEQPLDYCRSGICVFLGQTMYNLGADQKKTKKKWCAFCLTHALKWQLTSLHSKHTQHQVVSGLESTGMSISFISTWHIMFNCLLDYERMFLFSRLS